MSFPELAASVLFIYFCILGIDIVVAVHALSLKIKFIFTEENLENSMTTGGNYIDMYCGCDILCIFRFRCALCYGFLHVWESCSCGLDVADV